jgi:hypothetical protein
MVIRGRGIEPADGYTFFFGMLIIIEEWSFPA